MTDSVLHMSANDPMRTSGQNIPAHRRIAKC